MNIVDQIALRASADRPALIADGVTLSFGDLLERVSEVSVWLERCRGFRRNGAPRVGLACGNGVEYIVLALAILKAGGCLVPLADELTEPERLEIIERTGLCGMILGSGARRRHTAVEIEKSTGAAWVPLVSGGIAREAEFLALDPAFIRFSSGTTGKSKGVVLSHRKLRERIIAANAALEIGPGDRVLWMLPMAHHFAVSIMLYLYHGACTVIGTSHLAEEILERAKATRATVIYGAPFHFAQLAVDRGDFAWQDLRLAVSTAAPLKAEVARDFLARFGKPLVQGLGIIEIGLPLLNTGGARDCPTAVGRPLPAFDVELRDEEGRPMATGVWASSGSKDRGCSMPTFPLAARGRNLRGRLVRHRRPGGDRRGRPFLSPRPQEKRAQREWHEGFPGRGGKGDRKPARREVLPRQRISPRRARHRPGRGGRPASGRGRDCPRVDPPLPGIPRGLQGSG